MNVIVSMGAETTAGIVAVEAPVIVGLQPSALVDHMARVDWSVLHIPGETGGSLPVCMIFFLLRVINFISCAKSQFICFSMCSCWSTLFFFGQKWLIALQMSICAKKFSG